MTDSANGVQLSQGRYMTLVPGEFLFTVKRLHNKRLFRPVLPQPVVLHVVLSRPVLPHPVMPRSLLPRHVVSHHNLATSLGCLTARFLIMSYFLLLHPISIRHVLPHDSLGLCVTVRHPL